MHAHAIDALVARLNRSLVGGRIRGVGEYGPVVDVEVERGRRRRHLVVVTRAPGPHAMLLAQSPFDGAAAPARLRRLRSYRVVAASRPAGDRVLDLALAPPDGGGAWILRIGLYGARAGLVVLRDGHEIERLGPPVRARPLAPGPAGPKPPSGPARAPAPDEPARRGGDDRTLEADDARVLEAARGALRRLLAQPLRRHLRRLRRLERNLDHDAATARDHERVRREAETLAAHRARVPHGVSVVRLPDVWDPGSTLEIPLDPATPLQAQIDARFRRARRLRKRLEHATRRLELARHEIAEVGAAADAIERAPSLGQAVVLAEAARDRFGLEDSASRGAPAGAGPDGASARSERAGSTIGGTGRAGHAGSRGRRTRTGVPPRSGRGLRRFDLSPEWFALVGRDDRENDELTFRHASPDDFWFHARGVPGSHVVLKRRAGSGNPPRRVLEAAASLAAHFSRARHSALVPVICTRRRYVRKFRGARPGQVRCERETTLVVPPVRPPLGD